MDLSLPQDIRVNEETALADSLCANCGSMGMRIFHEIKSVPTNSCILLPSSKEALDYPKGDVSLGFCPNCGFISNLAFDPELAEYSGRYEESQGFSATFNAFHRDLANRLIERHQLYGKDIIEIGCGKGEFLTLLCELGRNSGVGFDPAYISERNKSKIADQIRFIKDFYSEKYSNYRGDFLVCKMTLEHIPRPFDFLSMIRRSMGNRLDTTVFFQVPDVSHILKDCSFEDIYYEHCSYFTPGSMACLFRKCGFDVLDLATTYNDQYLMIEARPVNGKASQLSQEKDMDQLKQYVASFQKKYQEKVATWKSKLEEMRANERRIVLWGSGSKGIAFLAALDITDRIEYVVDINPYKQESYMAGTGQKIVAPDFLKRYKPDIVIVMNAIYLEEISQNIERMGLNPDIITL